MSQHPAQVLGEQTFEVGWPQAAKKARAIARKHTLRVMNQRNPGFAALCKESSRDRRGRARQPAPSDGHAQVEASKPALSGRVSSSR